MAKSEVTHSPAPHRNAGMRLIWLIAGLVALALAAIGVLLPVLPTTPFVLVAAFAFGKGSPRLRAMLLANGVFGPLIRDWEDRGAINPRAKALACGVMAVVFLVSVIAKLHPGVLIAQALLMGTGAAYVLTRPNA